MPRRTQELEYDLEKHMGEPVNSHVTCKNDPLRQTLAYIRSLNHDGCQKALEQIHYALFTSNGKVIHDEIRNDKIVRKRYDDEKRRFTEQMFSYVSNGQLIPVELVNSLCRFLYMSYRHCFPGFMGFNRVTKHNRIKPLC